MRRVIRSIRRLAERFRVMEHSKAILALIISAVIMGMFTLFGEEIFNNILRFYVTTSLEPYAYASGTVDGKRIFIYSGTDIDYAPSIAMSVTNVNNFTVDIKNITVKVLDYRSIDDFVVEDPAGGAGERPIYRWECDISDKLKEYKAIYESKEDDSDEKYIAVESGDSGEFVIVLCPEKPGMYTIKVNTNYTFKNKIKTKKSKTIKFIYDPNHEMKIEYPSLNKKVSGSSQNQSKENNVEDDEKDNIYTKIEAHLIKENIFSEDILTEKDFEVYGITESNDKVSIDKFNISPRMVCKGNNQIKITYNDLKTEIQFEAKTKKIENIKVEYLGGAVKEGVEFQKQDFKVVVCYNNGNIEEIKAYKIYPSNIKKDNKLKVSIEYREYQVDVWIPIEDEK